MIGAETPTELLSVFPLTAVVQLIAVETAQRLGTPAPRQLAAARRRA
jgi:hypothetical protein